MYLLITSQAWCNVFVYFLLKIWALEWADGWFGWRFPGGHIWRLQAGPADTCRVKTIVRFRNVGRKFFTLYIKFKVFKFKIIVDAWYFWNIFRQIFGSQMCGTDIYVILYKSSLFCMFVFLITARLLYIFCFCCTSFRTLFLSYF